MTLCQPDTRNGPLARYVTLRVAHVPGMPGTFSPPPRVIVPDMHHGTCVTHVPWCMPGSLPSGFLWGLCLEKRFRHSRRMRNPQFDVSGKRPMRFYHPASLASCWYNVTAAGTNFRWSLEELTTGNAPFPHSTMWLTMKDGKCSIPLLVGWTSGVRQNAVSTEFHWKL